MRGRGRKERKVILLPEEKEEMGKKGMMAQKKIKNSSWKRLKKRTAPMKFNAAH